MTVREDFEDACRRNSPERSLGRDKHNGQWSDYYNNNDTHFAWVLFKALERIGRPHDCGCMPCTGSCVSLEALRITVDEMRELAQSAIQRATASPMGKE
jgi:hypothetical protein